MAELTTVSIDEITVDQELQVRQSLHEEKVEEYAQRMKDGAHFPPIYCGMLGDGDAVYVVDGFHRLAACKSCGISDVEVIIEAFATRDQMYEYAFRANNIHGINLTDEEIREGIIRIIKMHPEESLRALADRCGCSKSTISNYINQLSKVGQFERPEKTVGRGGREYPATRPAKEPDYTLCPQCGAPIWPENKGNPDYTYTERSGQWFCSPECVDQWEQERLSDEAEALTGIPDDLPEPPSVALPTDSEEAQEPVKHDTETELTEEEENAEIVNEIASMLKNFRPQRINNIIILLFNVLNLKVENIFKTRKKNILKGINAVSDEKNSLSEEEKTGFVWKLNDGSDWELARPYLETFKTLYPGIDVEQELRNSIGWSIANPKNRKTKTGILKHLTTWLGNAQNRAARQGAQRPAGRKSGYVARDAGVDFENVDYNY